MIKNKKTILIPYHFVAATANSELQPYMGGPIWNNADGNSTTTESPAQTSATQATTVPPSTAGGCACSGNSCMRKKVIAFGIGAVLGILIACALRNK